MINQCERCRYLVSALFECATAIDSLAVQYPASVRRQFKEISDSARAVVDEVFGTDKQELLERTLGVRP